MELENKVEFLIAIHKTRAQTTQQPNTSRSLNELCVPYNGEDLQWYPVDPRMNNGKVDDPQVCQPMKRQPITAFFKPKAGTWPSPFPLRSPIQSDTPPRGFQCIGNFHVLLTACPAMHPACLTICGLKNDYGHNKSATRLYCSAIGLPCMLNIQDNMDTIGGHGMHVRCFALLLQM